MSASCYSGPERRQAPRTTVEALAYISFGPDNGGIVLDVSEGGLRFRAIAPVNATETLRFWFSAEGYRVDAEGEVAWVDETRKAGGLRFKALAPDAREHIRRWVSQPGPALVAAGSPVSPSLVAGGNQDGKALLPDMVRSVDERLQETRVRMPLGTFSRGLLSGVVVSSLAGAAILLHLERRQFGESLIQIGQRLAAKSPAQTMSRESATNSLEASEELASPSTQAAGAKRSKAEFTEPAVVISGISPTTFLPMLDMARGPALVPSEPAASPQPEPPAASNNATPGLTPEAENHLVSAENTLEADPNNSAFSKKYLDVSDFRQKASADQTRDTLGRLGFHASVTRMGHLWMNSYHVVVGPYTSDEEAETARNDLESSGFHPRSHARRSRRFVLPLLTLAETDIVLKDCIISWDSNSSAATVSFVKAGNVVSKAQGRWVKRGVTYNLDAVVSTSNQHGPLTLLEIQCHGMNQALVFDGSKPVRYFIPPYRSGE